MDVSLDHEEGLRFKMTVKDHSLTLDTSKILGGSELVPSPKETFLGSLLACTAMDVASLFKKRNVEFSNFHLTAQADVTKDHPRVFSKVNVEYHVDALDEYKASIEEAITLSMTRYCGVSAMVAKACPIFYKLYLNGSLILEGEAHF
jgi:putative redox protein